MVIYHDSNRKKRLRVGWDGRKDASTVSRSGYLKGGTSPHLVIAWNSQIWSLGRNLAVDTPYNLVLIPNLTYAAPLLVTGLEVIEGGMIRTSRWVWIWIRIWI